jgi:hypothetical protein
MKLKFLTGAAVHLGRHDQASDGLGLQGSGHATSNHFGLLGRVPSRSRTWRVDAETDRRTSEPGRSRQ